MSITVDITVSDALTVVTSECAMVESGEDDVPEPALLKNWAVAAYLQSESAVASMLVTTPEEIQQLNKRYRDKDKATNVLSFPMQTPEQIDISLLGDIALCARVINHEAKDQNKTGNAHWAHMVVHGMLHLQGYDHASDAEAEEMEQLEITILKQLGFADPYQ